MLPGIHQSESPAPPGNAANKNNFAFASMSCERSVRQRRSWHAARISASRADARTRNQLNFEHLGELKMKIQDLSKELDAKSLSDVRGGDNGNSASNVIGQEAATMVPVMVGAGGPGNTSVHVDGKQNASVCNYQLGGDTYEVAPFPAFGTQLIR
jgi:hypothetical protein